jgi:hypothetical protein
VKKAWEILKNHHVKMTPIVLYRLIEECFQVRTSWLLEDIFSNLDCVCTLGNWIFAIGLPNHNTWNAMVMLHSLQGNLSHICDLLLNHVFNDTLDMALMKQHLCTKVEVICKEAATAIVTATTTSKPPKEKSKHWFHRCDLSQENKDNYARQGGTKDGK